MLQSNFMLANDQKILAELFCRYIATFSGQKISWWPVESKNRSQFLTQRYATIRLLVGEQEFVGILLKNEELKPAQFEKHLRRILPDDQSRYCLIAKTIPAYVRNRLVERKIPFVVPGVQVSWPELGMAVQAKKSKTIPRPSDTLKPSTQAVVIAILTGTISCPATLQVLGKKLGYTTMTISRAFDELQAHGLFQEKFQGRKRALDDSGSLKTLWSKAQGLMKTPVAQTWRVAEKSFPLDQLPKAGLSALSRMSMIAPPSEPVYATGLHDWKKLHSTLEKIPVEDHGTCLVQVWSYDPALFSVNGLIDRFSLYLSLRAEEDERIQAALEEMMERMAWS